MRQQCRLLMLVSVCFLLALISGCAAGFQQDAVRDRAVFDMDCPKEELTMQKVGGSTWGVRGCDHKATYVCTGPDTCVLNSMDGEAGTKKK